MNHLFRDTFVDGDQAVEPRQSMPNIIFLSISLCVVFATDPEMSIDFDRKSAIHDDVFEDTRFRIVHVNVTCHVKTDDITTTVTLEYVGTYHSEVEVVHNETRRDGRYNRYRITVKHLMRLPSKGYIICSARGDAGSHEITEPISKLSTGDIEMTLMKMRVFKTW